jgi:release factor glutamine methyltransferase
VASFRRLIERRCSGECVADILGRKEFCGLEFVVNPEVLVPRPDTETLVEAAIETLQLWTTKNGGESAANGDPVQVLDLCTGSGAVAIALKHEIPELAIWATDISAEALAIAKKNAARLLPPYTPIHFCLGNLYEALPSSAPFPNEKTFSLIVSNPPYIPSAEIQNLSMEVKKEPRLALDGGKSGLDIIRNIIGRSLDFLCPGGTLLLEADPAQTQTIAGMLEKKGFVNIKTYRDMADRERVIGGSKPAEALRHKIPAAV